MIQSKEYIIHQIANDIKTHIGQKYKDKSNIDWGGYILVYSERHSSHYRRSSVPWSALSISRAYFLGRIIPM